MAVETRPWVGRSMKRREDPALLSGSATFTNDYAVPGMLHAAVLRSPHPHATIRSVNCDRARALEGVVAVLSGAELAEVIAPLPRFCAEEVVEYAVAVDKVRYAGEAVAIAVAESRYEAEDALELVEVDYELLEPLVDPVAAAQEGAPLLHENLGTNVVYEKTFTHGDVEGDFARAAHVIRRTLRWPRVAASPMEPAGAVCEFDRATGRMDVHSNSNMLNFAAWVLSGTLQMGPELIDFHPMYTGGSFGSKHLTAKAIALAASMAKLTGRPVKFMEDRADNLLANDSQAPDRRYEVALALDADGRFLSLRTDVVDDYGAYFLFAVAGNTNAMAQTTGPYTIGSCENAVKAVLTSKNQQGVFRGAGSEVSNWVLERLVDAAAAELGDRRHRAAPAQPHPARPVPLQDPDGQPLRLRRLPGRAREGAGPRRARLLARRAGSRAGGGPVHRDRPGPGPAALDLRLDGVLVPQPRAVCGHVDHARERPHRGRPDRRRQRDDVLALLGQLARDRGLPARGRRAAGGAGRRRDRLRLDGPWVAERRAGRLADDGHALRRGPRGGREGAREDVRDRRAAVRGQPAGHGARRRPRAGPRRADESRSMSLADIGMKAYWYKADLPEGMESGLEGSFTYDHPYTTMPTEDRTDLGSSIR